MQIKAPVPILRHDDFREAGFCRFSLGLLPKLGGTSTFWCRRFFDLARASPLLRNLFAAAPPSF
jgi:hypothetical protein